MNQRFNKETSTLK